MVQLGLASLDGAPLTDERHRARRGRDRAHGGDRGGWNVDEIIAVATSAVREAPNRREFLRRVQRRGRHQGARDLRRGRGGLHLSRRALGGRCRRRHRALHRHRRRQRGADRRHRRRDLLHRSEPLGSLRLAQRFAPRRHARAARGRGVPHGTCAERSQSSPRILRLGIDICVGTSGTIQALATMATASETPTRRTAARAVAHDACAS